MDVKIPIFPTATPNEGFNLIRALCKSRGVLLAPEMLGQTEQLIPPLITPGAAEASAVKIYRLVKTESLVPLEALRRALSGYQSPVAPEIIRAQIELAIAEATDMDFVPASFRAATGWNESCQVAPATHLRRDATAMAIR